MDTVACGKAEMRIAMRQDDANRNGMVMLLGPRLGSGLSDGWAVAGLYH